jgi:hypothetical protein
LTARFQIPKENFPYARIYYYHEEKKEWLAVSSVYEKEKKFVMSDKIDFAQGIIGFAGDYSPLGDRIAETAPSFFPDDDFQDAASFEDVFTIQLGSDILQEGYTIFWKEISLDIPPLDSKEQLTAILRWNAAEQTLDYDLQDFPKAASRFRGRSFFTLKLPAAPRTQLVQEVVFWDNAHGGWRPLPSSYSYKERYVTAHTPFHFGKYKIAGRTDSYQGLASWFSDRLVSKTRFAAASNDYRIGTKVVVTNVVNDKKVEVEVVSSGPYVSGRIIDLTRSAFSKLAHPGTGVIEVRVEKGDDEEEKETTTPPR